MIFRRLRSSAILSLWRTAGVIACIYTLVSFLWIYLTDHYLLGIDIDPESHTILHTWEHGVFVIVTAFFIFFLSRSAIQRALRGEFLFRKVVETIPTGIWVFDARGNIVDYNASARNILKDFGIKEHNNIRTLCTESGQWLFSENCGVTLAIQKGESSIAQEIEIEGAHGEPRSILYSTLPLEYDAKTGNGALVTIKDITERIKAGKELEHFKFLVDQASVAIFCINQEGRFIYVNKQACSSLGYSQDELYSLYLWDVDYAFPRERWDSQQELLKQDNKLFFETCHKRKDGTIFPVEVSANGYRFDHQEHHVGFVVDISLRKKYQEQLEHQTNHDLLTGLANRKLLDDRIQQSIFHAQRSNKYVAVFLLDLDRFKIINESLGHSQGDNILIAVAKRLNSCIRRCDTLSRLGGDEFAIVLGNVQHLEDVKTMAQKILGVFDQPYNIGGRELRITTSLGASLWPRDGKTSEDLIRHADAAMYQAKSKGGNGFQLCSTGMDTHARQALELEADLRQALEIGEFTLYYQPKVNALTRQIDSCEALVRWDHPKKGIISPGDFIPLAEETGLIIKLGAWVFQEACRQFKTWESEGIPLVKIGVNLSARQFIQTDFVENIQSILSELDMDPSWIDLELTESMVMQEPEKATRTLLKLKELGFSLSLDDFGTGYSSLNYLRRFPIDHLKIDRSFIIDVASDNTAASVANSVIGIAHNLGMHAVAEGVESCEQYHFLADCECDLIQGFLFSKPLPPDEFSLLLKKRTKFNPCSKHIDFQ